VLDTTFEGLEETDLERILDVGTVDLDGVLRL